MTRWNLCSLLAVPLLLLLPVVAAANDAGAKTSLPLPAPLMPATGHWYDATRPGTGFSLQQRGDMLALVLYHFRETDDANTRDPDWHLAAAPLEGNTFEARLAHFEAGSCLGCDPFVAAEGEETDLVVRLVFSSAREATLQLGDGPPRPVVAMPFGVAYDGLLTTPSGLPLPDLRGRWLLGSASQGVFELDERVVDDAAVEYRGAFLSAYQRVADASLQCDGSGCTLWRHPAPGADQVLRQVGQFPIGGITEQRMTGSNELPGPLYVFRLQVTEDQP